MPGGRHRRKSGITRAVGARLRALREERDLSLAFLATKLGTSPNSIRLVETGDRAPTIVTLEAICDVLGVEVESVFARQKTSSQESRAYLGLAATVRALRGRPEKQLRALNRMIRAFDEATGES